MLARGVEAGGEGKGLPWFERLESCDVFNSLRDIPHLPHPKRNQLCSISSLAIKVV